jgi:hypothetical protein
LIHLHETDPRLLGKLRRALQSSADIRSVIASSPRLWALTAQRDATSPFLHGFTPPLYLRPLLDDEANALVFQQQMPHDDRFTIDEEAAALILDRCGNHPFLLQLVCSQLIELGDANAAVSKIAADRAAAFFFAVDFDLLADLERCILTELSATDQLGSGELAERCSAEERAAERALNRLQSLGFVAVEGAQAWLVNALFKRWLRESSAAP